MTAMTTDRNEAAPEPDEIDGTPQWVRQGELAEECQLDRNEFIESLPPAW